MSPLANTPARRALWASGAATFSEIIRLPFLQQLSDGSLKLVCFQYYVAQDSLYLRDFSRGLALLAAKAPDDAARSLLCSHAANAVAVEQALHAGFTSDWTPEATEAFREFSPTTLLYTGFFLRAVHERPFLEALAAFLPCYWIYLEVGKTLVAKGSPDPLYNRWIQTYAGDEFAGVVEEVLKVFDAAWITATEASRAEALKAFARGAQLEKRFWNAAWNLEQW
jgi:thiaminase/transcriptional activator TenA